MARGGVGGRIRAGARFGAGVEGVFARRGEALERRKYEVNRSQPPPPPR